MRTGLVNPALARGRPREVGRLGPADLRVHLVEVGGELVAERVELPRALYPTPEDAATCVTAHGLPWEAVEAAARD